MVPAWAIHRSLPKEWAYRLCTTAPSASAQNYRLQHEPTAERASFATVPPATHPTTTAWEMYTTATNSFWHSTMSSPNATAKKAGSPPHRILLVDDHPVVSEG